MTALPEALRAFLSVWGALPLLPYLPGVWSAFSDALMRLWRVPGRGIA